MKGLLKKEIYVLCHKPALLIIPMLVFLATGLFAKSIAMILYLPLYAGILPVSLITNDEMSRWDRFALGLPYRRSAMVSAKYLMSILLVLFATLITAAILLLVLNGTFTLPQSIMIIAAIAAVSLILPSLLMPLNLKFGTAKARLALMIFPALCICFSYAAINHDGEDVQVDLIAKIASLGLSPVTLTVIILAAAVILLTASWLLSVRIYKRKQF